MLAIGESSTDQWQHRVIGVGYSYVDYLFLCSIELLVPV